jgi:hypothetical protein
VALIWGFISARLGHCFAPGLMLCEMQQARPHIGVGGWFGRQEVNLWSIDELYWSGQSALSTH